MKSAVWVLFALALTGCVRPATLETSVAPPVPKALLLDVSEPLDGTSDHHWNVTVPPDYGAFRVHAWLEADESPRQGSTKWGQGAFRIQGGCKDPQHCEGYASWGGCGAVGNVETPECILDDSLVRELYSRSFEYAPRPIAAWFNVTGANDVRFRLQVGSGA